STPTPPPAVVADSEAKPAPGAAPAAAPGSNAQPARTAAKSAHAGASSSSAHHASAQLPEHPDRAQVIAAMQAVQPAVKAGLGGSRDTATASLKVSGRSGRVASVQVSGMPADVGSCLARAVRQAQFPKFAAESLSISYPLHR